MTKKFTVLFSWLFVSALVLLSVYISYENHLKLQEYISNNLISKNSKAIVINTKEHPSILNEIITGEAYMDIAVSSDQYELNGIKIHLTSKTNPSYKEGLFLSGGYYFTKTDFMEMNKKAVVGKNVLADCRLSENGTAYLNTPFGEYEVIGTFGFSVTNMLDNTVHIPFDPNQFTDASLLTLDSNNPGLLIRIVNKLSEQNQCRIINQENSFLNRTIFNLQNRTPLLVITIVLISLITLFLSLYAAAYFKQEIQIKRIIGFSLAAVYYSLLREISKIALLSVLVFFILYNIIYFLLLNNFAVYYITYEIFAAFFAMILAILLFIYLFVHIKSEVKS